MHGTHCIRSASTTQQVQALASGEGELYAGARAASHILGLCGLAEDLGVRGCMLLLYLDSSSSIGTMSRRGAGRIRHLQTPTLWLQALVANRQLLLTKEPGEHIRAGMLTKPMTELKLEKFLSLMGILRHADTASGAFRVV